MKNNLKKFSSILRNKNELMFCIFITLIFQICIAIGTMKLDQNYNLLGKGGLLQFIVLLFILIGLISQMLSDKYSFNTKQILFIIFSILNGLLLSSTIHIINDKNVIESAAIATLINFLLMFILGLIIVYFGYDLSWLGLILFICLMIILAVLIINIFTKTSKETNKKISIIIVILFSLFILYDTNNILLKYKTKKDCIRGALDYYLDILNLFSNYLRIKN